MLPFITSGLSLGFAAGFLPGPLQSYILNTTLALGGRRSFIIIFSPLVIDGPIILLVLLALRQFPPEFIRAVQVIGGLFLLWLAWDAWRAFRGGAAIDTTAEPPPARGIFGRALVMNIFSPGPYLFWGTVNGPLLLDALEQSAAHGLAFLVAFYGTFLGIMGLLVLAFDRLRRVDPRLTRALLLLTIGILIFFGITLLVGV